MMWIRRAGQAGVGVAISLVAVIAVAQSVDLGQASTVLRDAAVGWVAVVFACIGLDVLVRAVRWQGLLAPILRVGLRPMLGYLLVGYLANNLLPARLGELVRSHYLGDREGVSRTTALGTVVVERLVDTLVVVAIAGSALIVLNVRGVITGAVAMGAAIGAVLVVFLMLLIVAEGAPVVGRLAAWLSRWPRVRDVMALLWGGLTVARRRGTLARALVLSALAWGATLLAFVAAGRAVGLDLRFGEAALLSSVIALASAIPSGPAYLGTYELAAVKAGEALGLPTDPVFALALVVHATIVVVTTAGGAIALRRLGWRKR